MAKDIATNPLSIAGCTAWDGSEQFPKCNHFNGMYQDTVKVCGNDVSTVRTLTTYFYADQNFVSQFV